MALKGTLKDFGIADILQLIGQQTKTGTLNLTNKGEAVVVSFKDGNIVRAEETSRNTKDLIGSMLVRAAMLSEQQLDFALEAQKRTLQRLGDILVGQGTITLEKLKEMVQLQTSETLFKLFGWKSGTYAFEQVDVEVDSWLVPLRAESVLMEGFRRVDEWPVVKKKISSSRMTFEKKKELPPAPLAKDTFDDALEDAFAEEKKEVNQGEFQSVGENERRVYGLAVAGRPVATITEMSLLGEFETAKALCNLLNHKSARGKHLVARQNRQRGHQPVGTWPHVEIGERISRRIEFGQPVLAYSPNAQELPARVNGTSRAQLYVMDRKSVASARIESGIKVSWTQIIVKNQN